MMEMLKNVVTIARNGYSHYVAPVLAILGTPKGRRLLAIAVELGREVMVDGKIDARDLERIAERLKAVDFIEGSSFDEVAIDVIIVVAKLYLKRSGGA